MRKGLTIYHPPVCWKVGGSLLDLPDLAQRLLHLKRNNSGACVLVCGGGPAVDPIRAASAAGAIDDRTAHFLAIDAMSLNSRLVSSLLNAANADVFALTSDFHDVRRRLELGDSVIFDPAEDLRQDAGRTLPIGWQVSSDSIAAWAALRLGMTRLVLFKSVGDDAPLDPVEARSRGWVDDYFPQIAAGLECRLVNLRTFGFAPNFEAR